MTREESCSRIDEVIAAFPFSGDLLSCEQFGNGHINDTFLVTMKLGPRYILQRINHEIFKKPWEKMENMMNVCNFLRDKITAAGGDPARETLTVLKTRSGESYYKDSIGSYWSVTHFIEGTETFDLPESKDDFMQSGAGYGRFQRLLSDYPADTLFETIPKFHDLPDRFEKFKTAVLNDVAGRASKVREEIDFILARESDCNILKDLHKAGKMPLRVTHNDTKLNNIMFDSKTRKAICVIDLDTVMPGYLVLDFGDSIRFGAATSVEDEPDLSKMNFDIELFEAYAKGFIGECGDIMTDSEFDMLAFGAKIITLEMGMRFLTDYLEGDTYFKIHYPEQNLNRTRTQLKLVSDMEKCFDEMNAIIAKYKKAGC